ncbi:MAG: mandelate racemase/muconate lactonizing enzyme family protein [bacterium]
MKIERIEARVEHIKPSRASDAYAGQESLTFLRCRVTTVDGLSGQGVTGRFLAAEVAHLLNGGVRAALSGADPLDHEAVAVMLTRQFNPRASTGAFVSALSALDLALWDIKGKALGLPVSTLAGGHRTSVPTYASGALMRHFTLEQCVTASRSLVEQGWRQMKTQLALPGTTTPSLEEARIRLIREAIGADVDLMCDINQRWDVRQAISIGQRVEQYGLYWLEDVVAHDDYPGMAEVARTLNTPLAAGEYVYGSVPFRHMLEARSVDIVMIDVLRAGGITTWLKIAGMAQAFNLPVVSHLLPEAHVHLVSAIPNGLTVEYMPWSCPLFREVPTMKDGMLAVPQKVGLGLEFDDDVLARCAG